MCSHLLVAPDPASEGELISPESFEYIVQASESALPPAGRTRALGPGEVRQPVNRDLPPLEGAAPRAPLHCRAM